MGRAYSDDLRVRILEADERGEGSCRVLARRFGVSWEYGRKLRRQQAATGQKARVAQSRYGIRSKVTEPVKAHMLGLVKSQPDLTLAELRERILRDKGVSMSWGLVHLWVVRLGLRRKKKSLHAVERDTEANRIRRAEFHRRILAIDPKKLVFLDESGISTTMTRRFARCLGGARIHEGTPEGDWQIVTILGAMSLRGMMATMTVAAASRAEEMVQVGEEDVRIGVEKAWAKFKQLLRSAKARTEQAPDQAITEALQQISADNAKAWFRLTLNWVQL